MILHLSQFAGFLIPFGGWIAPICIWQIKKDQWPSLDAHGKIVANWLLTAVIGFLICIPLVFVIVGIPLVAILVVLCVVYPILGGLKANDGELWRYPMSISFFK